MPQGARTNHFARGPLGGSYGPANTTKGHYHRSNRVSFQLNDNVRMFCLCIDQDCNYLIYLRIFTVSQLNHGDD